jgi:hypothetical protein
MKLTLTPQRGLLFRITHADNLPWLLANGLHAANSGKIDPNFIAIGNPDLISNLARRLVPISPGGTLADYVPFYFIPKTPMLLNIKSGYGGITQRSNDEIVILLSSWQAMAKAGVRLVFTDRHAYTATAKWSANPDDLAEMIDWDILCRHDFARSDNYPDKMERYQAEALAYRHVPPAALLGIGCVGATGNARIEAQIRSAGLSLQAFIRPNWYF